MEAVAGGCGGSLVSLCKESVLAVKVCLKYPPYRIVRARTADANTEDWGHGSWASQAKTWVYWMLLFPAGRMIWCGLFKLFKLI